MRGDGSRISRRKVLGAVGASALAGAVAADDTAGLLADRTRTGAALSAGVLDLATCWADDTGDCRADRSVDLGTVESTGDGGAATLRFRLSGAGDTPAFVWIRTDCPAGECGLERALSVTVRRDPGCDGSAADDSRDGGGRDVLASGPLCEVLDALGEGHLLDADPGRPGVEPFDPGTERCLRIEWKLRDPLCGDETTTLAFEQFAQQARDDAAPSNPWPDRDCGDDCRTPVDCLCVPGVDRAAFCAESPVAADDVELDWATNTEGEPARIAWESAVPLDAVVLHYEARNGPYVETYRVADATAGTATVGEGDVRTPAADADGRSPSVPCPDGQGGVAFEYDAGDGTFDPVE